MILQASNIGGDGNSSAWPKQNGGNCEQYARQIQQRIGGEIKKITPTGGPRLGPSLYNCAGDWVNHFVV